MSVAVGKFKKTTTDEFAPLLGWMTISLGQKITGRSESRTETGNEQVFVFKALSVAVQVTVVVERTLNVLPEAGEQETLAMPEESKEDMLELKMTIGFNTESVALVVYVTEVGHVMVGLTASATV